MMVVWCGVVWCGVVWCGVVVLPVTGSTQAGWPTLARPRLLSSCDLQLLSPPTVSVLFRIQN